MGKTPKVVRSSAESATQQLILTSIGFGEKEEAFGDVKVFTDMRGGRFDCVVRNPHEHNRALLDEIKQRS